MTYCCAGICVETLKSKNNKQVYAIKNYNLGVKMQKLMPAHQLPREGPIVTMATSPNTEAFPRDSASSKYDLITLWGSTGVSDHTD